MVSVQPGAKRTEAVGLHDGALRVRLAAVPVDGRANEAMVAWLAGQLALPRRAIEIRQGASSRRKRLVIDAPVASVSDWLDRLGLSR